MHTRATNAAPAGLVLSLDAPSAATGTGTALVLDGQDAALVRATIVDANGTTVFESTANVTFEVVSGPGRVVGSHNGDDQTHEPDLGAWHSAFGGLVRGIVKVTEHSDSRLGGIDRDVAHVKLAEEMEQEEQERMIEVVAHR